MASEAIDRLSIGKYQLAVYPQKIIFGLCSVNRFCQPVFKSGHSIELFANNFCNFCKLLLKFSTAQVHLIEKLEKNEEIVNDSKDYQIENYKLNISIQDEKIQLLIHCECVTYKLNKLDVHELVDALPNIILKSYCYPNYVIKLMKEFIKISDVDFYTDKKNCGSKKITEIIEQMSELQIDSIYFIELIERHFQLLHYLKLFQ